MDQRNQLLSEVRKNLAVALLPIQKIVSAPFDISSSLSDRFATLSRLKEENNQLQRRGLLQNVRLQRMASLEAENERLRALLDSTKKVEANILIAEIVSVDMNPFRNMIVINKGSRNNAYIGQALIDADGIVGQITRDRVFSSEAMLITDADHAIPVEITRNRLRTIAVGSGELNRLALPFMPINADVIEGDLLISSGLGGTFPPGYPVGKIVKIQSITGQPFLEIDATPIAKLNRIREVLLITPEKPIRNNEINSDKDKKRNNENLSMQNSVPGVD
ncbi:MAG: rod shape-determining protein MreC [Pseudomonadota bacterium]|nr:rod shape-determining protein MreC [Pseudomonadota bacterium]